MSLKTKIFFLRRALGLAKIVDGFITLFTPFNPRLTLTVAHAMARVRGRDKMKAVMR